MDTLREIFCETILNEEIVPPDDLQNQLTKEIRPHLPEIEAVLRNMRIDFDEIIAEQQKTNSDFAHNYPIGWCRTITDVIVDYHHQEPFIVDFIEKGGVFKLVYGINKNGAFQNAIQMGNLILDVSGNTVDSKQSPVSISSIEEYGLEMIDSLEDYFQVQESYRGKRIFPNIYYPQIAPVIPAFSIGPEGTLSFSPSEAIPRFKNYLSNYEWAENYLFCGKNDHRLPKVYLKRLKSFMKKHPEGKELEFFPEGAPVARLRQSFRVAQDDYGAQQLLADPPDPKKEAYILMGERLRLDADEAEESKGLFTPSKKKLKNLQSKGILTHLKI